MQGTGCPIRGKVIVIDHNHIVMTANLSKAALIGIDWGTTSLRAFLIDANGVVLARQSAAEGIMQTPDRNFQQVLLRLLDPWMQQVRVPIIASGMITSRNGWQETAYLHAPATTEDLAQAIVPVKGMAEPGLYFVTGVTVDNDGQPDVMRGEETQIAGATQHNSASSLYVMPGTHSKWVVTHGNSIDNFRTFMTGEVFATLCEHTILGSLMTAAPFQQDSFSEGVQVGRHAGATLLNILFSARTKPLFGKLASDKVADYLSGMLIGAEIQGALSLHGEAGAVTIVGKNDLADRYEIALALCDISCTRAHEDIVAHGHFAIATSAGLLN